MNDFVTRTELNGKLDKLPSRWEVRFLILAGLLANQFIPVDEVARAALSFF